MSENPDQIITLEPDYCSSYENNQSRVASELDSTRQVIEIPPIQLQHIEYQSMSKLYSCGHKQVCDYPSNVIYGASVQAVIVYESTWQYTPFQRLIKQIWRLSDKKPHFECHADLDTDLKLSECDLIRKEIENSLTKNFHINHIIIQLKCNCSSSKNLISH